jgi:hypothetical protein
MATIKFGIDSINFFSFFFSLFNFFTRKPKLKLYQTHDYTHQVRDSYVFEPIDNYAKGNMTAYGKGVKIGDRIILEDAGDTYTYQVEQIDYYLAPPDMWIALLGRVTHSENDI